MFTQNGMIFFFLGGGGGYIAEASHIRMYQLYWCNYTTVSVWERLKGMEYLKSIQVYVPTLYVLHWVNDQNCLLHLLAYNIIYHMQLARGNTHQLQIFTNLCKNASCPGFSSLA